MKRSHLLIAILIVAVLGAWLLLFWEPARLSEGVLEGSASSIRLHARPQGGDFTLSSVNGPVHLADLRGNVVLIYFGYTACPDVCPTNLFLIAKALEGLSQDALARVQVLFISVDPERDDVQHLADYTAYFHPRIRGITGLPEQVARVADLYGAAYRRVEQSGSAMGYLVDHTAYTYVVDPKGRLARTLDHATPSSEIRAVIRGLLSESP